MAIKRHKVLAQFKSAVLADTEEHSALIATSKPILLSLVPTHAMAMEVKTMSPLELVMILPTLALEMT